MTTNRRDRLVNVIGGCVISIPILGFGILFLRTGCSGGTLSKDPEGEMLFGATFVLGGLLGLCFALAQACDRTPNIVYAFLSSVFFLILGFPFLNIGIYHPEKIHSDFSTTTNGVVFLLVGVTCFGIIPFIWRIFVKMGLLKPFEQLKKKTQQGGGHVR